MPYLTYVRLFSLLFWGLIIPVTLPCTASAAIALQQSRIVFNGDTTSVSLLVDNQNLTAPYLAQGWVEDEYGKKVQGPLLVLPPLQRIEPATQSQIKIVGLPAANLLRQDRETLFYLNLREIPPVNHAANTLNIALQNRIKIFYRPAALKAPSDLLVTPWQSTLQLERQGEHLLIHNPSPYYITLVDAMQSEQGQTIKGFSALMLSPGGSEQLPGNAADYGNAPVLTYLNDFGGQPQVTFSCQQQHCHVISNRIPAVCARGQKNPATAPAICR